MNKSLYFRRACAVAVTDTNGEPNSGLFGLVASLDANLRKLGYTLSGDLALALLGSHSDTISTLEKTLVAEAKEIKGVRSYKPMYPNFPTQVMEASDAELYLNAMFHYFGTFIGISMLPVYDEKARPKLSFDEKKFTVVNLGSDAEYRHLLVNLIDSKSAYSETDRADILALHDATILKIVRECHFTNRENKAFVAADVIKRIAAGGAFSKVAKLSELFIFDTATDVLRLAVAMSEGDVSLAEPTKFKNFSRSHRRLLLGLLNEIYDPFEDMQRNPGAWKRLGEKLHPGEFSQFPKAIAAFDSIRTNRGVQSFASKVEQALRVDKYAASDLLVTRPGEFARRLDELLRDSNRDDIDYILGSFADVSSKVSPTVLLQARNALMHRHKSNNRVFFPKGNVSKMQVTRDERSSIAAGYLSAAIIELEIGLTSQFRKLPSLEGTWVDPALKGIAIPFGLRSASKSLRTLGRGSRLPLGDTNILRFFIWWKDAPSGGWGYVTNTDIDLSACVLDEDFNSVFDITYYNLREFGAVHSGDITSAPNGASEFIDIDIKKIVNKGGRYVNMLLNSYSGQEFVELPECFAGFMERKGLGTTGEIYDPRTVTNKVDLTAKSKMATPFIFDLKTREAIWVDLSSRVTGAFHNADSTKGITMSVAEAMTGLTPPNLYDLFTLHGQARGGLLDKDKAKTIFAIDGTVSPFDTEEILANYL